MCYCLDPAFCVDTEADCPQWTWKCQWSNHVSSSCRKSCGKCTDTSTTTASDCQDTSSSFLCSYYVSNGYCSNSWINDGCKKSCGLCTSTTTTTTTASTTANNCQDGYPNNCPNWAANGFCTVGFFNENCKKSCDNCGTQVCEDEFSFCTSLASTSCSGWIADKCPKSCNKC